MTKTFYIVCTTLALAAYWCYVPLPPGCETSEYVFWAFVKVISLPSSIMSLVSKRQATLASRFTISLFTSGAIKKQHPLIEDMNFDGVPVRVFGRRAQSGVTYAALVHFHGSGWVAGNIDLGHALLYEIWNTTNIVIVTVEYRLAPENLFPAAFHDAYGVVLYLLKHASRFHVDPNRISVAGDSSGANIAAAVALRWRDEKISPPLSHQILGCPALQSIDFNTQSYREFGDFPMIGMTYREAMGGFWLTYLLGDWTNQDLSDLLASKHVDAKTWDKYVSYYDSSQKTNAGRYTTGVVNAKLLERLQDKITDPYAAPLAAENLRDLPPALILYGARDVLRTDAELYAHRLRQDGVNVTSLSPTNSFHCDYSVAIEDAGFFKSPVGAQSLNKYKNYINENF